jgi:hypothetical protein
VAAVEGHLGPESVLAMALSALALGRSTVPQSDLKLERASELRSAKAQLARTESP